MPRVITILINGEPALVYDAEQRLPARQRRFLDEMDAEMDGRGAPGRPPGPWERARWVANELIAALQDRRDAVVWAACAWLADRLPDLEQIRATGQGEEMVIELIRAGGGR